MREAYLIWVEFGGENPDMRLGSLTTAPEGHEEMNEIPEASCVSVPCERNCCLVLSAAA